MKSLRTPIADHQITGLKIGDQVLLSGTILTARDEAHKWLVDTFIYGRNKPTQEDQLIYQKISKVLDGGVLYHCGPVVSKAEDGHYEFVAAGPTTSIREEPYESAVMHHFNIKGIIGKGGMGDLTLQACQDVPAVYLHAVGGAGSLIAANVQKVKSVYKLTFGLPEAMWVIEVKDFPLVVTMDAHGNSLHEKVSNQSKMNLDKLLG